MPSFVPNHIVGWSEPTLLEATICEREILDA